MEDVVQIKLLFVAGLLVMSGGMALLAYTITRVEDWLRARERHARSAMARRETVKDIPVRGTR